MDAKIGLFAYSQGKMIRRMCVIGCAAQSQIIINCM